MQPAMTSGLDGLRSHSADPEDHTARHRRHSKDQGGEQRRNLAEAEQNDHRNQIGHMGSCLHHVESRSEDALHPA